MFSIFNFQFISHRARRGRRANVTTSYFTLHTSDFGGMSDWFHFFRLSTSDFGVMGDWCHFILSTSRFRLRLMLIHSEMHDVSRGGTETRSWAVFSIFNLSRTGHAEGAERLASLPTFDFTLPTSVGWAIGTTSYFRLHTSDLVWRHSMQGAGTRSVESPGAYHSIGMLRGVCTLCEIVNSR